MNIAELVPDNAEGHRRLQYENVDLEGVCAWLQVQIKNPSETSASNWNTTRAIL